MGWDEGFSSADFSLTKGKSGETKKETAYLFLSYYVEKWFYGSADVKMEWRWARRKG